MGKLHYESIIKQYGDSIQLGVVDIDIKVKKLLTKTTRYHKSIDSALLFNYGAYIICLPTYLHFYAIENIMKKSSSIILCEKPLLLNNTELSKLEQAYTDFYDRVFCAYVERFNEPYILAKEWIKSNAGPYKIVFNRYTKSPSKTSWYSDKHKGGDICLDLGIHDIDAALWLIEDNNVSNVRVLDESDDKMIFSFTLSRNNIITINSGWTIPEESKINIMNTFTIESKTGTFFYDSENESIAKDESNIKVRPRYPFAYRSELDHFIKRNLTNLNISNELNATYNILDRLRS